MSRDRRRTIGSRLRSVGLTLAAGLIAIQLAACRNDDSWHLTDVDNVLPSLDFSMMRASDGNAVTAKDYLGKIVILEFGYLSCPDICPATLANLTSALNGLEGRDKDVAVLFVTVDPARDTLSDLKQYVTSFSPRTEGLHGTPDQLADLARRYRVAYSITPASQTQDYDVMHSSTIYFFDRTGRIRLLSASADNVEDVTHDLRRLIDESGS